MISITMMVLVAIGLFLLLMCMGPMMHSFVATACGRKPDEKEEKILCIVVLVAFCFIGSGLLLGFLWGK